MINILAEISPLFSAVQDTAACHQRNSIILREFYLKTEFQKFIEVFLHPVNQVLQADFRQKNSYVDKLIEFLGVFCDTIKRKPKHYQEGEEGSFDEDPLIARLFEHLLEASQCTSDTTRFRSCQMINKILDHLVGSDISNELCDQLAEVLVDRLSDPKSVIRRQAVVALYRLQDPSDPEDKIIYKLIQLMYDSNAKIRQLCVEKVAARKDVIDHIIKRSRDIDPNVRLAAFKRLSKFPKHLKINEKRRLLFIGLFDTSEKVRTFVETDFLGSWLEHYDKNIIDLMKSVRLDADDQDIKKTMVLYENILNRFYFKTRSLKELDEVLILNEDRLIRSEELNWETVSYWKLYVMFLSGDDEMESHLVNVIPELVHFCRYVNGYTDFSKDCVHNEYLEKQYIVKQFFLIIRTYDLADPASRQSLHRLVDFFLKKVDLTDDVIETIVGCLELTMPEATVRCQFVCEIISDLLFPIDIEEEQEKEQERKEQEFTLSKLKVKLNCLQAEQEKVIAVADFVEAERLQHELRDVSFEINNLKKIVYVTRVEDIKRTTDLSTIHKCLDIGWAVLRTAKVTNLTPSLKSLKNEVIQQMLIHENGIVRMKALRCYAICCIYDKPTAQNGIHVVAVPIEAYQAGEECDTQTLIVCISAVSDLIRIYGAHLMAEPSDDQLLDSVNEEHQKVFAGGTSLTTLIQGLVDLMDDEQYEIQITACEGLCKLVLDERIHSSQIISRLVLKWCQPVGNDEPESETLKQIIGYVLERIPYLPGGSEELEGSVLLTISTLAKAPRISPLADVDIDNIAKFMLALCKISPKGERIHSNIGLSICTKINQHPNVKISTIYSKILLMIDVPKNKMIKRDLFELCEVARANITEKTTYKNVSKFMASLEQTSKEDQNMLEIAEEQP